MMEILFVLGIFGAITWAIVHALFILVRVEAPVDLPSAPGDPISTYVDENYGSHFVDDPVSVNHSLHAR
jgi:hypothetical protein